MQNIWVKGLVRGQDGCWSLCCVICQALICGRRVPKLSQILRIQGISFPGVRVPSAHDSNTPPPQRCSIIATLPVVFSLLKASFHDLDSWEGNTESDSLWGTSIYIFNKYLPQTISANHRDLSVSWARNKFQLDLLV